VTTTAATSRRSHRARATRAQGADPHVRRLHRAAAVRIGFGLVWAVDATFKWLPGFIHGQTIRDELGQGASIHTPVIHQWLQMWHAIGGASPGAFAVATAITETAIALGLVFGVFSNAVFVGSALYSLGIWSSAEAFGLPWSTPGITDVGPSAAYIFASLALLHAHAGATWSVDTWLRARLGRLAWLSGPAAGAGSSVASGAA
jgi:uncharacterized membrane protein YphA (DoxX/SURF4 family)